MRELNFLAPGKLAWLEKPEPELVAPTDAIVRPFVASRCDGDTLPMHQPVSRAFQAGLKSGALESAIRRICGPIPYQGPFPIGHETIAEVVALGSQVTGLTVGDRVVVSWSISCGSCPSCLRGLTSKCVTTRREFATGTDGNDGELMLAAYGFGAASGPFGGTIADLVRVPYASHTLVKLPDGLDPLRVAAAADNLANAWQVVVPFLQRRPGAQVLVVGGGAPSIGLYAAGLAAAHGASVVDYQDASTSRLAIAESLGANPVERAGGRLPGAVGILAAGFPEPPAEADAYDLVIEAASSGAALRYALRSTAPGGEVCPVGYYVGARTGVPVMHMYATDITLHASVSHPRAHLPDLLAWVQEHDFAAEKVTTTLADFDDAPSAYGAHSTKVVLYRDPLISH
ncbi:alcohol dehydrogenase catalytic domain-containing protein [Nocardioides cheoyonin]|uniref:alcohol dehydrogenase catalytic domain-containing protein n=1 Tax=Nocardioides cheoyonin TaxID=3156615 RepID=UPI0032B5B631